MNADEPEFNFDEEPEPEEPEPSGDELAAAGAEEAMEHADAVYDEWSEKAYAVFLNYGNTVGEFMAEDVARYSEASGLPPPPDRRAWGGVVNRAKNAGVIEHVRYSKVKTKRCHSGPRSVWRIKR